MSKTVGDSIVSINNGQLFRTLGNHDWGALVCFHHVAAVELAFHVCLARTQAGQNTVNRNITKPFGCTNMITSMHCMDTVMSL